MATEQSRLISLIEYAQHTARMKSAPVSSVSGHGLFALWEAHAQGLPGLVVNPDATAEDDERWLILKRLQQSAPPPTKDALLSPWLELTQSPHATPQLKQQVLGGDLVAAGTHRAVVKGSAVSEAQGTRPEPDPAAAISLEGYEHEQHIRVAYASYVSKIWAVWAQHEKAVRETITLYSKLFTLKQQFEEGITEQALELVWGVGVGLWDNNGDKVCYPLVTRLAELSLDETTGTIEIRPRDAPAQLALDWYAAADNPGVVAVERASKEFFQQATVTVSPFDRGSFEPLLRSAVTHLDANGTYRPDQVPPQDRSIPKAGPNLVITDTWVLFARPRSTSLLVQDLERFKQRLDADPSTKLPLAVAAIVTEPASTNSDVDMPMFRGVSVSGSTTTSGQGGPRDLFFPKPFNEEQVRIAQFLEVSDGVVVQGPPGTGKTHTIANVIAHCLASGKRVLVTSMKDPALGVLRDQLPEEIRPLAISLLATEQDGMKQFEHAIHKIASEVQSIDRVALEREIQHLQLSVDALHAQVSRVDTEVTRWAKANLEPVEIDGERISPQDAAEEVVQGCGQFEWFDDELDVGPQCAPRLTNQDVLTLREARRHLGPDIVYLGAVLPSHSELPDLRLLQRVHDDLRLFDELSAEVQAGEVPVLRDSSAATLDEAAELHAQIATLETKRLEVANARRPWTVTVHKRLAQNQGLEVFQLLAGIGRELLQERDVQREFLKRPVDVPPGFESDPELVFAAGKLAQGQSAFKAFGVFAKNAQKQALRQVQVLERSNLQDAESWQHVCGYLEHRRRLRQLAIRWNALVHETGLDPLPSVEPRHGMAALSQYQLYERVAAIVEAERVVAEKAAKLFPAFDLVRHVMTDVRATQRLAEALHRNVTRHRLSNVWATRDELQSSLQGKSGPIVAELRRFLVEMLGSPLVALADMNAHWASLMSELARLQALSRELATVHEVTSRMIESGALQWAMRCRQPLTAAIDVALPDNWRLAWRLRRLETYLSSNDAHSALKKLADDRSQVTHDLARAYESLVSKRTWLKLTQNATPNIRAALQAYLVAIQKIGKGTGKRAVRYRKDARDAATAANPAVPCWIMPHHRVSESLPAEFGGFDLVVIDEASQSDLTALPALLRSKKILVVGDDKQVSPEGVGLEEEKVRHLMNRFLGGQVSIYRPQLSPERSLYDLFKVVFQSSSVMLKEHFRCVPAIIEYSKREFYNHELRPLRIPRSSERLDPPLIDVLVEDGFRSGDINRPEADFIVKEIENLARDERMRRRSIGVVSLLGDKQAMHVWERLTDTLGPEAMQRHHIACGDARTFQGKERDVMFMTMVSSPNNVGAALSRETFAQRFNVAASRARDRMYLVRSVELDQLSEKDILRRSLISHFGTPFLQDEETVADLRARCESPFEREIYDELTKRGFNTAPQVKVGNYRIDLVVEGANDARLAIECDGDQYHGVDQWADDMKRQRVLERAGWVFWRCFASAFVRRRDDVIADLLDRLRARGIEATNRAGVHMSLHCEARRVRTRDPVVGDELDMRPTALAPERNAADVAEGALVDEQLVDGGLRPESELNLSIPKFSNMSAFEARPRVHGQVAARAAEPSAPSLNDDALRNFLSLHALTSEDNRSSGGALWIHLDRQAGDEARLLEGWGFKFRVGRGWWRK